MAHDPDPTKALNAGMTSPEPAPGVAAGEWRQSEENPDYLVAPDGEEHHWWKQPLDRLNQLEADHAAVGALRAALHNLIEACDLPSIGGTRAPSRSILEAAQDPLQGSALAGMGTPEVEE